MKILVTGGSGFIGSAYVMYLLSNTDHEVLNFDNLSYAATRESKEHFASSEKYNFLYGDITDKESVSNSLHNFKPDILVNFAAETHVDKSIQEPLPTINSNVFGVVNLLECSVRYWNANPHFKFHHISTDEVYGDIDHNMPSPDEDSPFFTNSPYSASKASSDLLVRAWNKTYGLPVVITNCTNNYGPYQYPEKLIPLMILKAIKKERLPVYGNGKQERDWLFVDDHVKALAILLTEEFNGDRFNISSENQVANITVVKSICEILSKSQNKILDHSFDYTSLIAHVEDRPGHDKRYALDSTKFRNKFSWSPSVEFNEGLEKTVNWYLENSLWWENLLSKKDPLKRQGL